MCRCLHFDSSEIPDMLLSSEIMQEEKDSDFYNSVLKMFTLSASGATYATTEKAGPPVSGRIKKAEKERKC